MNKKMNKKMNESLFHASLLGALNEHLGYKYNAEENLESKKAFIKLYEWLVQYTNYRPEYLYNHEYDLTEMGVTLSQLIEEAKFYISDVCPELESYINDRIKVLNGALSTKRGIYSEDNKHNMHSYEVFVSWCRYVKEKLYNHESELTVGISDVADGVLGSGESREFRDRKENKYRGDRIHEGYLSQLNSDSKLTEEQLGAVIGRIDKLFDVLRKINEHGSNKTIKKLYIKYYNYDEGRYYNNSNGFDDSLSNELKKNIFSTIKEFCVDDKTLKTLSLVIIIPTNEESGKKLLEYIKKEKMNSNDMPYFRIVEGEHNTDIIYIDVAKWMLDKDNKFLEILS